MIKHDGKEYKPKELHKVTWDDEKDEQLKVLRKAEKPVEVIAKCFGYSTTRIFGRLKNLGLTDNPWTSEQDQVLRANYLTYSNAELARLVKSNTEYVSDRLDFLGLNRG